MFVEIDPCMSTIIKIPLYVYNIYYNMYVIMYIHMCLSLIMCYVQCAQSPVQCFLNLVCFIGCSVQAWRFQFGD